MAGRINDSTGEICKRKPILCGPFQKVNQWHKRTTDAHFGAFIDLTRLGRINQAVIIARISDCPVLICQIDFEVLYVR